MHIQYQKAARKRDSENGRSVSRQKEGRRHGAVFVSALPGSDWADCCLHLTDEETEAQTD